MWCGGVIVFLCVDEVEESGTWGRKKKDFHVRRDSTVSVLKHRGRLSLPDTVLHPTELKTQLRRVFTRVEIQRHPEDQHGNYR